MLNYSSSYNAKDLGDQPIANQQLDFTIFSAYTPDCKLRVVGLQEGKHGPRALRRDSGQERRLSAEC